MKVPKKGKSSKNKVNKKVAVAKVKPKSIRKEQVLVVAQEIKYARLLSGNEKKTRDRVLKALKKWLTNCFEKGYEFKEDDFTRVWKGLFYAVWMSDKPLVQEELCENIAAILDLFPPEELKHALLMAKAGFKMLATEWYGIDQHRMDKFLMLVRRYLRGSLRCLSRCDWSLASCKKYAKMLSGSDGLLAPATPHYARNACSMLLHIVDCFLEELAKVSQGEISGESLAALLQPFISYTCSGRLPTLCVASRRLLMQLLRQSDQGQQYADRTSAWRRMGCPEGGPDALELASDDEEDPEGQENGDAGSDEESDDGGADGGALDPRAGRVDVTLRALPVPARRVAAALRALLPAAPSGAHKRINICLQRFEKLAAGEYPLPEQSAAAVAGASSSLRPLRAVRALRALDAKLKADTDELKLRGLSRKHRKRLLRRTRLGHSIADELNNNNHNQKNGGWLVESTTADTDACNDSNKENQNNKKKDKTQKRKLDAQQHGGVTNKKQNVEHKKAKKEKKDIPKKAKQDIKEKPEAKIKEKHANKQTQKETEELPRTAKLDKKEQTKTKKTKVESPKLVLNKLKNFSKQLQKDKVQKEVKNFGKNMTRVLDTPKKVKFVLKNNSMQKPVDYYKSVRQSPSIPFDSARRPSKTNLKPASPSPINPFFKKKLRIKH